MTTLRCLLNSLYLWDLCRYEPLSYLLGSEYFLHAYGPIYALSADVVASLVTLRNNRQAASYALFSHKKPIHSYFLHPCVKFRWHATFVCPFGFTCFLSFFLTSCHWFSNLGWTSKVMHLAPPKRGRGKGTCKYIGVWWMVIEHLNLLCLYDYGLT